MVQTITDNYNAFVGTVIAVISVIFGEHWYLFALFLALNIADWVTGWMKSRIMKKENLDHDAAKEKVEHTDEERAAYYYEHTGKTWGDVNDYHMILDTSELGVENCADILMRYFEMKDYI